jgi:hypothetical protein
LGGPRQAAFGHDRIKDAQQVQIEGSKVQAHGELPRENVHIMNAVYIRAAQNSVEQHWW